MSFLDKVKTTATRVGAQATVFGQQVAREAQTGSQKALTNFKLESEVRTIQSDVSRTLRADAVSPAGDPISPHSDTASSA